MTPCEHYSIQISPLHYISSTPHSRYTIHSYHQWVQGNKLCNWSVVKRTNGNMVQCVMHKVWLIYDVKGIWCNWYIMSMIYGVTEYIVQWLYVVMCVRCICILWQIFVVHDVMNMLCKMRMWCNSVMNIWCHGTYCFINVTLSWCQCWSDWYCFF